LKKLKLHINKVIQIHMNFTDQRKGKRGVSFHKAMHSVFSFSETEQKIFGQVSVVEPEAAGGLRGGVGVASSAHPSFL
jgi:hypothetical protein